MTLEQFLAELIFLAPKYAWSITPVGQSWPTGQIRCRDVQENGGVITCPITYVSRLRAPDYMPPRVVTPAEAMEEGETKLGLSATDSRLIVAAADGKGLQRPEIASLRARILKAVGLPEEK